MSVCLDSEYQCRVTDVSPYRCSKYAVFWGWGTFEYQHACRKQATLISTTGCGRVIPMMLSEELRTRGFIQQHTGESLADVLDGEQRTVYYGIDPSADSAHAGNFVNWILLRHLVDAGHKVIFLVGGGTGMIGDPKPDAERVLQDESVVTENVEKIKAQAERLIGTGGAVTFVNNADWLTQQPLIAFLRDVGKHFTVNELVKKDAIASRMQSEQGISYTEFAYPLLQAFDYLQLHEQYGCDLQVGGSDQWGNIVAGVELIRRKKQVAVHAITMPLVTDKATGKKFGKSEGNAVWLDAEKTTPYEFYQFWLNTSDESVIDYLKLFTFLSLEEIGAIETDFEKDRSARLAQRRLAEEVTRFVHGDSVVLETPRITVAADVLVLDTLIEANLASSKREAREFIMSGAVTLDGEKVSDPEAVVRAGVLQRGKKKMNSVVIDIR